MANVPQISMPNPNTYDFNKVAPNQGFQPAFDRYATAVGGAVDAKVANYLKSLGGLAQMQAVPQETVQSILNSGRLVSAATGFNTPTDLLGLTPDAYQQVRQNEMNPMQILDSVLKTADSATGVGDFRRTMEPALGQAFRAGTSVVEQAGHAAQQSENNRVNQQFKGGMDFEEDTRRTQGLNAELSMRAQQLKQSAEQFDRTFNQRERELTYIKQNAASGADAYNQIVQSGGVFYNENLGKQAALEYNTLVDNKANVPAWQKEHAYAKQLAYNGATLGTVLPLGTSLRPAGSKKSFDYMVLGKNGWVYASVDRQGNVLPEAMAISMKPGITFNSAGQPTTTQQSIMAVRKHARE